MYDKIYCINLDHRTDRWEETKEELAKMGWEADRYSALPSFNHTMQAIMKRIRKNKSSLILEDDVEFRDAKHLAKALAELPDTWDLFSLGATVNRTHKEKQGTYVWRYYDGWATHAVAYSKRLVNWIADNFDPECGVIYDEWLRLEVLPKFNCYIVKPFIAYQRPSFSDIRNRYADYTKGFEESENKLV